MYPHLLAIQGYTSWTDATCLRAYEGERPPSPIQVHRQPTTQTKPTWQEFLQRLSVAYSGLIMRRALRKTKTPSLPRKSHKRRAADLPWVREDTKLMNLTGINRSAGILRNTHWSWLLKVKPKAYVQTAPLVTHCGNAETCAK